MTSNMVAMSTDHHASIVGGMNPSPRLSPPSLSASLTAKSSPPTLTTVKIMRGMSQEGTTNKTLVIKETSEGGVTVIWTYVSSIEAIQKLLRTLKIIQDAVVGVSKAASETPLEAKQLLMSTLDGALTPISPSIRNAIVSTSSAGKSSPAVAGRPLSLPPAVDATACIPRPIEGRRNGLGSLSTMSEPRVHLNMLQSLILYIADHSGVMVEGGGAAQPITSGIMVSLLKVISTAAGINLEEILKQSQRALQEGGVAEKAKRRAKKKLRVDPKTGLLISYTERDDLQMSLNTIRRMQRMMHHEIKVKPFDAKIKLPYSSSSDDSSSPSSAGTPTPSDDECCTPNSFPPSPEARTALLNDFMAFTEEVLYRARDELRYSATEVTNQRLAIFNPHDAHSDIVLTCGGNCAAKKGKGLYRGVRSVLPVIVGRPVLFEMEIQPVTKQERHRPLGSSITVGIASQSLVLSSHVGGGLASIGLCSSGHVVTEGQWHQVAPSGGFGVGDTVGVVVNIEKASSDYTDSSTFSDASGSSTPSYFTDSESPITVTAFDDGGGTPVRKVDVYFFINGKPFGGTGATPQGFTMEINPMDMFATLSLCTNQVRVLSHFSYEDINYRSGPLEAFPHLLSLDGVPLLPSSL